MALSKATVKNVKWSNNWLNMPDANEDHAGSWARQQANNNAFCSWCKSTFSVRSGFTNLRSHSSSEKHRTISQARKTSAISKLIISKSKDGAVRDSGENADARTSNVRPADLDTAARVAEVRCVTRIVLKLHSFQSEEDLVDDLQVICSDSKIPAQMQLRATKIAYIITDALYPYLRDVVLADIRDAEFYALHIDETNNKGTKYLGIVARYLPRDSFDVHIACVGLPCVTCTSAEELANAVAEMADECKLMKKNCLSIMSDNCNVMRGAKSGVVVRLKKHLGFTSIADVGGCSLHHIHNVAKHACDASELGKSVESLMRDVYCYFKYHANEQERLLDISDEFDNIKKLVFLRPVETRWLQILTVVERILNMFEPLVQYFQDSNPTKFSKDSKFSSIKAALLNPTTEFFLCFLADVLKPLQQFELIFQQEGCHVHQLHCELLEIMKRWLLRFIQPGCLPDKFWKVNEADVSIQLSPYQMSIGESARRLFNNMSADNQKICLQSVRAFFATGTSKLREYLPFGNKFLRACQVLDPQKQMDPHAVNWVSNLARELPSVIAEGDIASLEVEMRLHRLELNREELESSRPTVAEFWSAIEENGNRPLLVRLARALLILPHGNAEVERVFSTLNDTVTKKRSQLAPTTVKALIVARSGLRVRNWTAASLPVSSKLLHLCYSARAAYSQRLKDQKKAEDVAQKKRLEETLMLEVESEKRASKAFSNVEEALQSKSNEIEHKIAEKEKAQRLLEEVQKTSQSAEKELEQLRRDHEKLLKKKERESQRVTESVVKRAASDLLSASSSSASGISKELPESVQRKRFRLH